MIDKPFYGYNPATEKDRTISRISGPLFAPVDGEYLFAGSADDRAAMYIDGKPALLMPGIRRRHPLQHASFDLTRGRHEFVVYHLNTGLDFRLSVGWRAPGVSEGRCDPAGMSFGATPIGSVVGRLEQLDKPMTADFQADYRGEFFVADKYLHRYRFSAVMPKSIEQCRHMTGILAMGKPAGIGCRSCISQRRDVIRFACTFRIGANSDAQTTKFIVMRNYERTDQSSQLDDAKDQSKFVAQRRFCKASAR